MNLVEQQLNKTNQGLACNFHVSPDSCERPEYYSNYIQLNAVADYKTGMGVTHLFVDTDANVMAGYITIRATSLISSQDDGTLLVRPAVEVAELAVHEDYARKGIGTELLNIAVAKIDAIRETQLGIKNIVVCSDPHAVSFYKKYGFVDLSSVYDVLHDGWNNDCDPLILTLPEQPFK